MRIGKRRTKNYQDKNMKLLNRITRIFAGGGLALALTVLVFTARAEDKAGAKTEKPKPDKLTTCPVSGDKLGEMGKPHVFTYQGQEVKLCCPHCKKDIDNDPAKFLKKIREADKNVPADKQNKN